MLCVLPSERITLEEVSSNFTKTLSRLSETFSEEMILASKERY